MRDNVLLCLNELLVDEIKYMRSPIRYDDDDDDDDDDLLQSYDKFGKIYFHIKLQPCHTFHHNAMERCNTQSDSLDH